MASCISNWWWDHSWNPVGGCQPVSPGCQNCYAARRAGTLHQQTGAKREVLRLAAGTVDKIGERYWFNGNLTAEPPGDLNWTWPLRWRGARYPLLGPGKPSLVFVVDMGDLFIEGRPTAVIDRVVTTIAASDHIGQLVTKRTHLMAQYFAAERWSPNTLRQWRSHLWLAFSAENQHWFDVRWSHMRALADAGWVIFMSLGPLLGPVTLPTDFLALGKRGWVICSGEQGRHEHIRDMDLRWSRALRDQCRAHSVPFFFKQTARLGPIPPDLLIREFPDVPAAL